MNKIAIVAGLVVLAALPAAAQNRGGFGGTISGGDSFGTVSFPALNEVTRQSSYPSAYAQGSFEDYEPSKYLPYDEAVKMGIEALHPKPKPSIAEVARENRARKERDLAPDENTTPAPGLRNGSSQTTPSQAVPQRASPATPTDSGTVYWI